jgi:hypothetical protein
MRSYECPSRPVDVRLKKEPRPSNDGKLKNRKLLKQTSDYYQKSLVNYPGGRAVEELLLAPPSLDGLILVC